MTSDIWFRDLLANYATKLIGLGPTPTGTDLKNFFFIPSPDESDEMINAIRNKCSWPVLIVEFPDNDITDANKSDSVEVLKMGFAILANNDKLTGSESSVQDLIYNVCKPLADQVLAKLQLESDDNTLEYHCGNMAVLQNGFEGNWIGPILNNVFGYRYTIKIKIYNNSVRFEPTKWLP
jgi:hypothetical protein